MCVTLPLNCLTAEVDASGKILCTECSTGFLDNYQCVAACPLGTRDYTVLITDVNFLVKGAICIPCSTGCDVCTDVGCTTCNADMGYTPLLTGCSQTLCVGEVGKYYDGAACVECVAGC